ncbi:MAG: flagellar protein [Schwartzia sp.]|nr:flagellar protein [Schwartzia sp. (in: firmicutes)]
MARLPNLKNCPECGKVFLENGGGYCPACMKQREAQKTEIISFLRDHPASSVDEICETLGVKKSLVIYMLQPGRLDGIDAHVEYPCAACGTMIVSGRYCRPCSVKMTEELDDSVRRVRHNAARQRGKERRGEPSKEQ